MDRRRKLNTKNCVREARLINRSLVALKRRGRNVDHLRYSRDNCMAVARDIRDEA